MARHARIPKILTGGPFTLADADAAGVPRGRLRGEAWRRIGPGTYLASQVQEGPYTRLEAAALRLPAEAAFSGLTAAWLHGLIPELPSTIEVTVPPGCGVSARAGMSLRRCALAHSDVVKVAGLRVTAPARTVRDLCAGLSLTEAVVFADAAAQARLVSPRDLHREVERSSGGLGVRMLRRALEYLEPASESHMESRLRMLLVLGGLPRPEAQVDVRDRWHRLLGRPDLYYRDKRLGLEYDGVNHRDRLLEDNRRQNRLVEAGVTLLRFAAADIYETPELTIITVRKALAA